jgi:phosphoglycerol transferase MdoB-like AlkP superfamily enzyme
MPSNRLIIARHLLLIIGGSLLLETLMLPPENDLWQEVDLVLANLLPVLGLALLLYCLLGRIVSSLALTAAAIATVRFVNDEKLAIMGAPLSATDSLIAGQALVSPELVLRYMGWLPALGFAVSLVTLIALVRWEKPRLHLRSRALLLVFALLSVFIVYEPIEQHYVELRQAPWKVDPALTHMGLAAYLVQDALLMNALETPVADAAVLAQARKRYQLPAPGSQPAAPDLIIWLGESFIDPRIFRDIDSCEHTPEYCRLAADNTNGSITVPTFAGQTIRTEFEILTGVPMARVPEHHFPYMSLTNVPVNSLAWELRALGYETTAVHNHERGFWRRPVALRNLGFQRWIGIDELENAHRVGNFNADDVLTDAVVKLLNESAERPPQLIFAISMQSHGPYGNQPRLPAGEVKAIPVPKQLRGKNARILREYLFHLRSADRELGRLADFVRSRERPTVVLYFGDHLPGLRGVYKQLEFENGLGPREQMPPFLLFGNYELMQPGIPDLALAAWQLPTLTLRVTDLLGEGSFAWFNLLNDELQWSASAAAECEDSVCEALQQFQYQQLGGPQ